MTDVEMQRRKAICEIAGVDDIGDLSDGFHTFKQLYYQRMMLFATIVKQNKGRAWKSLRHENGELCFGGGWFIVGIDTPEGSYTYHYEDNYFSLFDCKELERGKHWDGHTEKDVTRLLSLPVQPEVIGTLPSAQPERKKDEWIPISKETNPTKSGWYLVTVYEDATNDNERFTGIAEFDAINGMWYDIDEPTDVYLRWMPLPAPYRGGEE